MFTESFQEYNGFIIRLRFVEGNGASYSIIKKRLEKNVYLRKKHWDYQEPDTLLQKAKDYIDKFSDKLIEKFNQE